MIVSLALFTLLAQSPSPSPSAASPSDWLAQTRAFTYASKSGDNVALSKAMGAFAISYRSGASPWVRYDRTDGLLLICMHPSFDDRCDHSVYVRTADVGVPSGAIPAKLSAPTIGMPLNRLLAYFASDSNLASKTLVKGAYGDVVTIAALDAYPGPKEYDHGHQYYSNQLYLLRDDVVVAAAFQTSDN